MLRIRGVSTSFTSMNESYPYYFFLKTENYEPLVQLLDKLVYQINENQRIIKRLTTQIDYKFTFPQQCTSDEKPTATEPHKTLVDKLLIDKYHFDEITKFDDMFKDIENETIRQLKVDNEKLKYLKKVKIFKNNELLKIYEDYEVFLVDRVLPPLRDDINNYNKEQSTRIKTEELTDKTNQQEDLWKSYNDYVEFLHKLLQLSNKIVGLLEHQLKDAQYVQISQNIAVLNNLIQYLSE